MHWVLKTKIASTIIIILSATPPLMAACLIGTYWIDPNGGHPADAFTVHCNFDENCATCIDMQNKVGRALQQAVTLSASHLAADCITVQGFEGCECLFRVILVAL